MSRSSFPVSTNFSSQLAKTSGRYGRFTVRPTVILYQAPMRLRGGSTVSTDCNDGPDDLHDPNGHAPVRKP
jgi:hypothetical protein